MGVGVCTLFPNEEGDGIAQVARLALAGWVQTSLLRLSEKKH